MNRIVVRRRPSGWTAVVNGIGVVVLMAGAVAVFGWAIALLALP